MPSGFVWFDLMTNATGPGSKILERGAERMQSDQISGTWRLADYEAHDNDGSVSYPLGRNAVGYLIYTDHGFVSVAMMAAGRKSYARENLLGGTDAERLAAADGFFSYCGRYEVEGDSVLHHIDVAFFPNRVGTSQRRFFRFAGDRLLLTTPPMLILDQEMVGQILWERAESP